jgi:hypothetical protein
MVYCCFHSILAPLNLHLLFVIPFYGYITRTHFGGENHHFVVMFDAS